MRHDQDPPGDGERKPYVKPAVSKIPLKLEEVVLGGCKLDNTTPGPRGTCSTPVGTCLSTTLS